MKIEADLHVHTVASGHAFSTVMEIAREAEAVGLKAFGISDHGPALPGAPGLNYFRAMGFLPDRLGNVRVLRGVEANIVNRDGKLDLPDEILSTLDYVMIGYHDWCGLEPKSPSENTEILLKAMDNRGVRAVTHPGNPSFPIETNVFVEAARAMGIAIEINNSSFKAHRSGSLDHCSRIAAKAAEAGAPVILSSDAHIATAVGMVSSAWEVASKAGVVPGQVVNRTLETTLSFLGLKG